MGIDFTHYEGGREPAFVKHTFLDRYLPNLIAKIGSSYPEFVFVDGFAGPWRSTAGESFGDTSFGIALKHMTALKASFGQRGRRVRMFAILVEKDGAAHSKLESLQALFPTVEIATFNGLVEDHIEQITNLISDRAFVFSLFDPKGFPDPRKLAPLLSRRNSESLVNFMFDFANRFATTGLIPALETWLEATGVTNQRERLSTLHPKEREIAIENLAREGLRQIGGYRFAPSITVDRADRDRPLYKLIYLSRHDEGLAVFRDSERKALEAQAESRSQTKAAGRERRLSTIDLFSRGEDAIANDRSSIKIKDGEQVAKQSLLNALAAAGSNGRRWRDLWPPILSETVVTRSVLGKLANELRKSGKIEAPDWPSERTQIPPADQILSI